MYLLSSVKEAESMSNKGLRQALKSAGVYEVDKWDRLELVATWLEKFGVTELPACEYCGEIGHHATDHEGEPEIDPDLYDEWSIQGVSHDPHLRHRGLPERSSLGHPPRQVYRAPMPCSPLRGTVQ